MSSSSPPAGFEPLFSPAESGGFTPLDDELGVPGGFEPLFGGWSPPPDDEPEDDAAPSNEGPDPGTSDSMELDAADPGAFDASLDGESLDESLDASVVSDEIPAATPEVHDGDFLQAREEAYEVGRRAGLEAGAAEIGERVDALQSLLDDVAGLRRRLLEQSVRDVADATVEIARRMVRRELSVGVGDLEGLVEEILGDLRTEDEVVVQIAPEDDRFLRDGYPALLAHVGRDASLRIEASAAVTPGGVLVETNFGTVDATVESRFEAFAETVEAWARDAVETADD